MKKQLIAKLLVLGMVLAMLPAAAMASGNTTTADANKTYANDVYDFGFVFTDTVATTTPAEKPEEPAEPETPATPDVTAPVEVEETVSAEDAANLVKAAVEADVEVLTVTVETKVAMPATALADLADAGKGYAVTTSAATITVSSEALAAIVKDAETVEISAEANEDGTVTIAVLADGKAIEDIPGGLDVVIPMTVEADAIAKVVLVKADGTEVELEYEVVDGQLKVNVTATGSIRVDKK